MAEEKQLNSDTGDKEAVEASKQTASNKADQLNNDLREILKLPAGRRVVQHWIDFCGLEAPLMTGNNTTFYNVASRNVGLKIKFEICEQNLDLWQVMEREKWAAEHPSNKKPAKQPEKQNG